MNKELLTIALAFGCIASNATTNNYDLLGRKGSKMNSPMVYRNVDYSKVKKNEQQKLGSSLAKQGVGLKDGVKAIVGWSTPNGYLFKSCGNGSGCASTMNVFAGGSNLSTYLSRANNNFIPVYSDNLPKYNDTYSYQSAGVTRSGYSGYQLGEAPYDMPLDEFQTHASYGTINSLLNRNVRANSNVGLYLSEEAVPVRLNPFTDPNPNAPFIIDERNEVMNSFSTMPGHEMRASKMYKLVHSFSDRSVVYVTRNRPSNPASHSHGPQAYIGVHGYGGSDKTDYNSIAKSLDNYIYNNRTIEIVAAGNNPKKLSAKGFAVNAITVGALDPLTGKVASYSGKGTLDWGVEGYKKPDIYNYSNFYIDDYYRVYSSSNHTYDYKPFYEGTEAATGVTAGMISDMLSNNEFFKWHPEVVKAMLVNINQEKQIDYEALVYDNEYEYGERKFNIHNSAYFIGDVNSLMKVYNDALSDGTKKEIRFSFSKNQLCPKCRDTDIDGFDIAIAWLNSGNDIANLQKLPQNYHIYVYTQHGTSGKYTLQADTRDFYSDMIDAPYKATGVGGYHSFVNCNLKFTVRIVLEGEDPNSENYGQMVLGLDVKPIIK